MGRVRRHTARLWLPAAGAVLGLLISAAVTVSIIQARQRDVSDGGRELSNLALALGEQTERTFQSVELIQASLIERIDDAGIHDRASFDRAASAPELHEALKDKISGLPQVDAVTIINADGKLLNFSRYWPIPDVNTADRDYFKALQGDAQLISYVSAPVPNRGSGTWTIYLARKVTSPSGEFLGLILGAIRLEYFEQFYAAISLGPHSAISLMRRDGLLLARHPHVDPSIARGGLARTAEIWKAAEKDAVITRQISPMDGKDRLLSARALARYPLVVIVGQEIDSILGDWRSSSVELAAVTILIDLLIAVAVGLAMRQLREQRQATSIAHHAARHDSLTGLPNRLKLRETLATRLDSEGRFSLLCVDLDRFKAVNDGFGHPVGDELLQRVTDRLRGSVGAGDLVARIGGDEFAIVHVATGPQDDGTDLADLVLATLATPFDLGRFSAQIGASIGIAVRPDDGSDAAELMRNADIALYRAKAEGRGRWRRFEPEMGARLRTVRALERDLARAIDRNELALHYQPIVCLATGRPTGFEALLRWQHPERGAVSPCEFIPIAESTGLIVPIGQWVLNEACREARTWPAGLAVSVNLSPAQIAVGGLVDSVKRALASTGLDPNRLELEITETALLHDDDAVLAALHDIRALGVRVALDDFGVGYSSLSYVTSFPFDRIKIDRSFVQKMKTNDTSRLVVATILQLAQRLNVSTTGEGVETPEHLDDLRAQGCTEGQGFYFGRPQSAAEIRTGFFGQALRLVDAA